MGDGKALQMGTSHEFGQNFAKVFGIDYLDDTGAQQTACTTSWGVSTRMIGGLIMAHGDDNGLRVPPRLAAVQVVVIAVRDEGDVVARCRALVDELRAAGVRAELDDKTGGSLGRRVTDWELKGVPLRLEVGPRDLAENAATLAFRISGRAEGERGAHRGRRHRARRARSRAVGVAQRGDRPPGVAHGRRHHARRRARRAPRPAGHACPGRRSAPTAKPSSRRAASPSAASCGPTARCPTTTRSPISLAYVARAY